MEEKIIKKVKGFEVLDSRGNPTVAVEVTLCNKSKGFAISPSGASTGVFEAHEKRDGGSRYFGKGVKKTIEVIENEIEKGIIELNTLDQRKIDEFLTRLDGTKNKSRLGANVILAVSLAVAKAAANYHKKPLYQYLSDGKMSLPRPMLNILNGGAHAKNNIDIQEFMISPVTAKNFSEGLRQCTEIYHTLGKILKEMGKATGVGDEGGFAPDLESDEQAIEIIIKAIETAGYSTNDIKIALDVASSEWYENGEYVMPKRNKKISAEGLIEWYEELTQKYPIISIEDGVAEDDWDAWCLLTKRLGDRLQLVGDDFFVTNTERLQKGIERKCGNAILVKPNQIGTLTETIDVVRMAQEYGYKAIISHRSGESEDITIADLAVALNAGQIKTGAPCRSERTAKYNRLLVIENKLSFQL